MQIALIAEVFPPLRSSGAVQLRDLSREFLRQGHSVTVLVPAPDLEQPWSIEHYHGVEVARLRALKTRDTNYIRRVLGEFLMPFFMLRNFRRTPISGRKFDGIVWYSPTIFLGPIVKALKWQHGCPSYLIIRDIFPEWALDVGVMRRGPSYYCLKAVAEFQYSVADVIGVQASGNMAFFDKRVRLGRTRVEVLQNWLTRSTSQDCPIDLSATSLAGRHIFVYAGNMGVAQGMGNLLNLAEQLQAHDDLGFVFVGRGSDAQSLREEAGRRGLMNVLFFDEIEPDEVAGLYAQCAVGLVALDPRHKTHNIPGKFISYMHAGLPVLATINKGNDLEKLVAREQVGLVSTDPEGADLVRLALQLVSDASARTGMSQRCRALAARLFSSEAAVNQITSSLRKADGGGSGEPLHL